MTKKVCVLSGKGGTGKTFVSTNLFNVIENSCYADCDVEEPNGHIFFSDSEVSETVINKLIPDVDHDKCIACRKCVDFCKFGSLSLIFDKVYFFDEMCHSCGGCKLVCPENAITEVPMRIGTVEKRTCDGRRVLSGKLDIGNASGTGIIEALLDMTDDADEDVAVIDCPPGSDCSVMESIKGADYAIIVGEPTVFGIHNLQMVCELLTIFKVPFGIVANKVFESDNPVTEFAKNEGIPLLMEIPFDRELAKVNGSGKLITNVFPFWRDKFENLAKEVLA